MAPVLKGENEAYVRSSSAGHWISGGWVEILVKDGFLMSPVGGLELT